MMKSISAAAALLLATPALAQTSDSTLPDPNDRSDTVTVGLGAAYIPDYEGSDDYRIIPAGAIRGRVGGISFFTRATYLYVDVVPRGDSALQFDVGPIVGASVATRPMIGDTMFRFDAGKSENATANTLGIMPPPMNPCSAR